jgi:hypothetical protein
MRLRSLLPIGLAIAAASVACSALFDDAVQCSTDADCASFANTVCGAEGTCVVRGGPDGSVPPGSEDGSITGDSAPAEDGGGPTDIVCVPDAARLLVAIPGTTFDAGAAGGVGTEITKDTRLSCDKDWSLTGTVVVRSGATLRIDRSVMLRADLNAALVVQPGGRLLVEGTATEPVVVTSAKSVGVPGDFRGVFVLGRAAPVGNASPNNDPVFAFGGTAPDDSSGSLKFLRIEYATQGLHLGGVGRGTVLDSIQVRRTSDDAITFNGGTVNGKHIVVQLAGDEAFVLRNGYQGKLQYVISQRVAAGLGRNGLLVEGARPTIYNATFCGTPAATPNLANGLLIRTNGRPDLHNTVVSGYAAGYDQQGDASDTTQVASCVFFGQLVENLAYPEDAAEVDDASPYFDDDNGFDEAAFLTETARGNSLNDPQIARCFNADNPGFAPATKLAAPAPPADGFFETAASFRGAVKDATDDWTKAAWLVWSSK